MTGIIKKGFICLMLLFTTLLFRCEEEVKKHEIFKPEMLNHHDWNTKRVGHNNGCDENNLFHVGIGWQNNYSVTALFKGMARWKDMHARSYITNGKQVFPDSEYRFGVDNPGSKPKNDHLLGTYRVHLWMGNYGKNPIDLYTTWNPMTSGYYTGAEIGFYKFEKRPIVDFGWGAWYPVPGDEARMEFYLVRRDNSEIILSNSCPANGDGRETWWLTSWNNDMNDQHYYKDLDLYFRVDRVWGNKWMRWSGATDKIEVFWDPDPESLESIEMNKSEVVIEKGNFESLYVTFTPEEPTNKELIWSSSDELIATVSEYGAVTALSVGEAIISAESVDGNRISTCRVIVPPISVDSIVLNKDSTSLLEGESEQLGATIYPSDATDKSYTWSSSDVGIVSISSEGLITANSPGRAIIKAIADDNGQMDQCEVIVAERPVPVIGVSINQSAINVNRGSTTTASAIISPADATNQKLYWSSSYTDIFTVSNIGFISAKSCGSATLTATTDDGDFIAECPVKVNGMKVKYLGTDLETNHNSRITFAPAYQNYNKTSASITLINSGMDNLEISSIKLYNMEMSAPTTEFVISDRNMQNGHAYESIPFTVGGDGATKEFKIDFKPINSGAINAMMVIKVNKPNYPELRVVLEAHGKTHCSGSITQSSRGSRLLKLPSGFKRVDANIILIGAGGTGGKGGNAFGCTPGAGGGGGGTGQYREINIPLVPGASYTLTAGSATGGRSSTFAGQGASGGGNGRDGSHWDGNLHGGSGGDSSSGRGNNGRGTEHWQCSSNPVGRDGGDGGANGSSYGRGGHGGRGGDCTLDSYNGRNGINGQDGYVKVTYHCFGD